MKNILRKSAGLVKRVVTIVSAVSVVSGLLLTAHSSPLTLSDPGGGDWPM